MGTLEEYDLGDLEKIYANITNNTGRPMNNVSHNPFVISFPDVRLSVNDIWPDGDAPDNPTPDDVIEAMEGTGYSTPASVVREWELIKSLFILHRNDETGIKEVEWDGS